MFETFENMKQRVRSWIKNALKALKVDFSLGIDFHLNITNKTA